MELEHLNNSIKEKNYHNLAHSAAYPCIISTLKHPILSHQLNHTPIQPDLLPSFVKNIKLIVIQNVPLRINKVLN